jgi:hypothetical protein
MEYYPKSIYYPRESVDSKFESGELNKLFQHLLDFVVRHQSDILVMANELNGSTDETLLEATRKLVLRLGTVHPPSEMADQIREIQKEVWYRGEEGNSDMVGIKEKWSEEYAMKWREARTYETFYLIEKRSVELLAKLKS